MIDLIDTAWLVSLPLLVLCFIIRNYPVTLLFWPTSRVLQFIFGILYFGIVAVAALRKSGSDIELAGRGMTEWMSSAQLLVLWVRGVYLLLTQPNESTDQSNAPQHEYDANH